MAQNEITVPVKLDAKTFKRFSRFDMLRLRKRWVRPVVFALMRTSFLPARTISSVEVPPSMLSVFVPVMAAAAFEKEANAFLSQTSAMSPTN